MKTWNPDYIEEEYRALKLHFTTESYDYFKYQGKTKAGRKDNRLKWKLQKLGKHENPKNLIIACLSRDKSLWLGDIVDFGEKTYIDWKKTIQSLTYRFRSDIKKLENCGVKAAIEVRDGNHPLILKLLVGKTWTLETFTIFVYTIGCLEYLNKRLHGDILWDDVYLQVRKYHPFLEYDPAKYRGIIKEALCTSKEL